jgi:DNA-binding CsgD family transcriptional regulator
VHLLERARETAAFDAALEAADRREGRVLLVSGEAGIGKTTLVRELVARARDRARVLVGACDDLLTPRTLGPFRDLPLGEGSPLRGALERRGDRDAVLAAVTEEFSDPLRPTVLVIEDAHWADEATRDVLAFLGRRVAALPTVLVVTYRDDLPGEHPLRAVLGHLAGPAVTRLPLRPLSVTALDTLAADRTIDAEHLRRLTGGNPFLVTEVLAAADPSAVPATVKDAVRARMHRLVANARDVLVLLAVAPGGLELDRLARLDATAVDDLAATERAGLTEVDAGRVRFRHDLLREAVTSVATATELAFAHARILADLERTEAAEPSRAAHHALGAADVAAVVRYVPAAARQAMEVSSHRDAIVLLEEALRHEQHLTERGHVDLLRWYAFELYLANRHRDAFAAAQRAVSELGASDDPVLGKALTLLSHTACWAAEPRIAREAAERAVAVLEDVPDAVEAQVTADANLSFVLSMQGAFEPAVAAAERAVARSDGSAVRHVRPYALIQLGGAVSLSGDPTGERHIEEGIELAQRVGRHEYVPLGCSWLCDSVLQHGRPDEVERWAHLGTRYADEHQIEVGVTTLRMLRSELLLRRGEVAAAEAALEELTADLEATAWGNSVACTLLGRSLARRGEQGRAFELLGRGWRLALQSAEPVRLGRAGAGWYEWSQLYDDARARAWGDEALAAIADLPDPSLLGELQRLRAELDDAPALPPGSVHPAAGPWAAGLRGDWREAAAGFAALGWPVEQARELASSGRPEEMVEALALYDRVGARRSAWQLRRRLRELGVERVPRGPVAETLANPAGLTARQAEVLALVARGLTNAQIADELVLSVRTVDHHVSAVLTKLGVTTRAEAVAAAERSGVPATAG